MRRVITVVLPVPAPATISRGPSENLTAFFCSGFNPVRISLRISVFAAGFAEGLFFIFNRRKYSRRRVNRAGWRNLFKNVFIRVYEGDFIKRLSRGRVGRVAERYKALNFP